MSQLELNFDRCWREPLPASTPERDTEPEAAAEPAPPPPTIPPWARSRAIQEKTEALLRSIGCLELAKKVSVRWNPRMRSTAGTANHRTWAIKLNPALIIFGEAEVDRTLRHELAHLVAHHRVGKRKIAPHGAEWQLACADLGIEGEERCHTLPLPRRTLGRRYRYRCAGCGVELARVKPIIRATACLTCCRKHNGGKYDERFRFVRVTE